MMRLSGEILAAAIVAAILGGRAEAVHAEDPGAGPSEAVRAIGAEARATAREIHSINLRSEDLRRLAEMQIGVNDVAGARETLSEIEALFKPPAPKFFIASAVAALWIEAGDPASALAVIDGDTSRYAADDAVRAAAELGDFDAAFTIARHVGAPFYLLAEIAAGQCRAGAAAGKDTLAEALAGARAADPKERAFAGGMVVEAFAACGEAPRAVEIADELDPRSRISNVKYALERRGRVGDFAAVRAIAAASNMRLTAGDLFHIADQQIDWQDWSGARATLAQAYSLSGWGDHSFLWHAQIRAGAYDDAWETVEAEDWHHRPAGYLAIIEGEATRRATDALKRTLPLAIKQIRAIDEDGATVADSVFMSGQSRGTYLSDLAAILGRAGYVDDARETLQMALELQAEAKARPTPRRGFFDLSTQEEAQKIALARIAIGDGDKVLATLRKPGPSVSGIPEHSYEAVVIKFAIEFARRGDVERVIQLLADTRGPGAWPLRQIAMAFAEKGDDANALSFARRIQGPDERFACLVDVLIARRGPPVQRF